MRVREPIDWREWRDLRLRALADTPDAFAETLARARAKTDADWIAAVEPRPDRIVRVADGVGIACGVIAPDGLRANLYAMWVAPEGRRRGLGSALVEAIAEWCRARGVCELRLDVTHSQGAALGLYRACGFVDTGLREPLRPGSSHETHGYARRIQTLVMGVVNVTPDSFSDGGQFLAPDAAVAHAIQLARDGADILDVGGEATNPRARPIGADEELRRVLPVIERLAAAGYRVSIDTTKAEVARAAVAAGATIINDVSGGAFDPAMPDAVGDATYIAGHLRGGSIAEVFAVERPVTWQEVAADLAARLAKLSPTARQRAWVDPGVGFGKGSDPVVNLTLLRHAGDIGRTVDTPVVVGASRKRFVRRAFGVHDGDTRALDDASVTASLEGVTGGANVVRVHNVALLRAALALYTKQ